MTGTVSRKMDGAERPIHCVLPLTNNKNQRKRSKKFISTVNLQRYLYEMNKKWQTTRDTATDI